MNVGTVYMYTSDWFDVSQFAQIIHAYEQLKREKEIPDICILYSNYNVEFKM
jgi:hypothetical protein